MYTSRAVLRASRAAPSRIAIPRAIAAGSGSQARGYATPAAASSQADSKPPKALYGLDGTYATALVRLICFFFASLCEEAGDGSLECN